MAETGYKFKQGAGGFPPELADRFNETGIGSLFTPLTSEEFTENGKTFVRFPEQLKSGTLGLYRPDEREIYARPPALGVETFEEESIESSYQNTLAHEYIHDAAAQTKYFDSLKSLNIPSSKERDNFGEVAQLLAKSGRSGELIIEEVLATMLADTFEPHIISSTGMPPEKRDVLSKIRFRLSRYKITDKAREQIINDLPFLVDHFATHMLKQQAKPSGEILNTSEAPNYK